MSGPGAGVVVAGGLTGTNAALLAAFARAGAKADVVSPLSGGWPLRPGGTVLARLDVTATMNGIEPGMPELARLHRDGTSRVLNPPAALVRVHDKRATALALAAAGVPHPLTAHVRDLEAACPLPFPVVVKPRFGSWGTQVYLCRNRGEYATALRGVALSGWWADQGALVQARIPAHGPELRVVVACGRVAGAIERRATAGQWRANVALGASQRPVTAPAPARSVALAAAAATGADVVAVDLLPVPGGGFVVVELNGAFGLAPKHVDIFDRIAASVLDRSA